MLNNSLELQRAQKYFSEQIKKYLAFDDKVDDRQGNDVSDNYIIVKEFCYDISNADAVQPSEKIELTSLQKLLDLLETNYTNSLYHYHYLIPVIRLEKSFLVCSLIFLEIHSFNNRCVGYAQCLDNTYQIKKSLQMYFARNNIEILEDLPKRFDFHQSLAYLKEYCLHRINLFYVFTNNEMAIISRFMPIVANLINLTLNIDSNKLATPIKDVLINRMWLVTKLEKLLSATPWFNINRIVYAYLLRKSFTGMKKYINENGLLVYNDQFFRNYENLSLQLGMPYVFFSEYTFLEFQILSGLNEYIELKEDIIDQERQNNIRFYYKECTSQNYIKTFLLESTHTITTIYTLYNKLKNYIDATHPPIKNWKILFFEFETRGSDLGEILSKRLQKLQTFIKQYCSRFTVFKTSDANSWLNDWILKSIANDVLFFCDLSKNAEWKAYIRLAQEPEKIQYNKLPLIIDKKLSCFLDCMSGSNEFSIENYYFLSVHFYMLVTKHIQTPKKDEPQKILTDKKEKQQYENTKIYDQSYATNNLVGDLAGLAEEVDKLKLLAATVGTLKTKIEIYEKKIESLTIEKQEVSNDKVKIKSELISNINQHYNTIIRAFLTFDNLVAEFENELSTIKEPDNSIKIIKFILRQIKIISEAELLNKKKAEFKKYVDHKILYICKSHESINSFDIKAPILLLDTDRESMKLYGNFTGEYQIYTLPDKVYKKVNELLDETGCDLTLEKNGKPIEIECSALTSYQFLELFRKYKLHDYKIETRKLLELQSSLRNRCHAIMQKDPDRQNELVNTQLMSTLK